MTIKSFQNVLTIIILATLLMITVSSIAFADEINNSVPPQAQQTENELTTDVIIPEEILGKHVQTLPTYKGSNLGTFNNVDDLAAAIMKANKAFESTITYTYTGNLTTINEDLPNAIYIALGQPGNDYVLGTLSSWLYNYTYTGKFTMNFTYLGTLEQENYVTEQVKAIAASLTQPGMTELDKVRVVNDYVVTHTIYSTTANSSPHLVYTYLTEGKAVCQAYALLTYRLLTEMGVEARYVVGDAGGPHAWNSVKIDGVWYHLDTTWNDSSFNGYDTLSNVSYRYFLVTSETLRKNHTWNEEVYPVATDTRYSYFHNIYLGIEHNGEIYYTDATTRTLNKLNLKSGKSVQLVNRTVYYLAAHNEFVYYSDYSNRGYLTAYNILTGETKIIDESLVNQLQIIDGFLHYKVWDTSKSYELPLAEVTPAIEASNVTVTNNFNKKDVISFKNLIVGSEYSVYKDEKKQTKITSFTATSATASIDVDQLGTSLGSIYIVVKQPIYSESVLTEVKYAAEVIEVTPAIAASNVTVTNNFNKPDVITFKKLIIGHRYIIYKDAAKKTKLTSFTASSTTKTINVQQLGVSASAIYITTTKPSYKESVPREVKYAAEVIEATPAIAASNVVVTNNFNKKDVITFTNLVVGAEYSVYKDEKKQTKITSITATSATASIDVDQLGTSLGSIYIVVKQPIYSESVPTEVKYKAEVIEATAAIVASNITVTNNFNKPDVITFKKLVIGHRYIIYKDAKKKTKLTSFTASSTTKTINVQQLGTSASAIYITTTKPSYKESVPTEVKYAAEVIEATPAIAATNITVTNNFNKPDVITFKKLVPGQKYFLYKDAAKKTKLTSFTASSTTKTINVQQLGASASAIYITTIKANYKESATTKVNYKAEQLPALAASNVIITNNIASDKLVFKGLTKGYVYTVYTDAALKNKLTSFTATATTKNLSVQQVGAKGGFVYVVVSKSGYLSSTSTKVSFKAQPTTALSNKNVKVTNAKEKDTIQLTGLKKGTTYVIYQDEKKKTKLATFKATGTTKTVTVKQLGTKAGNIYITAQESGYLVSTLTTVSYSKQK